MEPVLPQPHVVIVGRSPSVHTLARLLVAMEWRATVVDDGGDGSGFSHEVAVLTSLDGMGALGITDTTAIVVATQGHYDEPALEAALSTPAPYIGLVASSKRAASVLGYLRDRGHAEATLRRIHTPAGLDLGHIEHREIAVAVLAQLVAIRASGGIGGAPATTVAAPRTAVDPVCGMTVEMEGARFVAEHDGAAFYFCCPACKKVFEEHPADYVHAPS